MKSEDHLSHYLFSGTYPDIQEHPEHDALAYYVCIKSKELQFYMVESSHFRAHLRICDVCLKKSKDLREHIPEDIQKLVDADTDFLLALQIPQD